MSIVPSTLKLAPLAEERLNALHLETPEKNQVINCISRYSTPKNFSEGISYVAYRIWNAIKSIFGASDWQETKKMLGQLHQKDVLTAAPVFVNEFCKGNIPTQQELDDLKPEGQEEILPLLETVKDLTAQAQRLEEASEKNSKAKKTELGVKLTAAEAKLEAALDKHGHYSKFSFNHEQEAYTKALMKITTLRVMNTAGVQLVLGLDAFAKSAGVDVAEIHLSNILSAQNDCSAPIAKAAEPVATTGKKDVVDYSGDNEATVEQQQPRASRGSSRRYHREEGFRVPYDGGGDLPRYTAKPSYTG